MNKTSNSLALVAVMLILAACQTVYRATTTLTQVADSAATAYATAYNNGIVPTELAQRIAQAHLNFRIACNVAKEALVAYKNGGPAANPEQYNVALTAAQQAAQQFVSLVVQLLPVHQRIALQQRLKSASEP